MHINLMETYEEKGQERKHKLPRVFAAPEKIIPNRRVTIKALETAIHLIYLLSLVDSNLLI